MFPLGLTGSPQDINRVVSLTEFSSRSDTGPDSIEVEGGKHKAIDDTDL